MVMGQRAEKRALASESNERNSILAELFRKAPHSRFCLLQATGLCVPGKH